MSNLNTGDNNIAIGYGAMSSFMDLNVGDNNIAIGLFSELPSSTASDQVRIGNDDVSHAGVQVGWSISSDKIWKEQIRDLPFGMDMLMQLKPVDYYRKNNDFKKREMGFIAQDIEVLLNEMGYYDQGFLTKDDHGRISLRYNDFIALLTKGMQEQQEIIETQQAEIEGFKTELEELKILIETKANK